MRYVDIDGESFALGTVDELPPPPPRRPRVKGKDYPQVKEFARLAEGLALFIPQTKYTLQDDQSWWQRRFNQVRPRQTHSRQDHERQGVWFWWAKE